MSMFRNTAQETQRASRANEPTVWWLYARLYQSTLTFANNTADQITYAYVSAPASATQAEVLAAIPERALRSGVGMKQVSDTVDKCNGKDCDQALSHYSTNYTNVTTASAGQFRVE